ncbi:hypothetical protein ACFRMQ_05615 [Kitasatospora sp. NPDC056783]|uniref:hypothetical protein n=1 Tax=Kitasatospora sp. NPDC056783 TaxID=3345943 RepID=UPI003684675F
MDAEDRFEEELVTRLERRAARVTGSPPPAGLREAGQRRARRRTTVRVVTAAAVVALGVTALTRLAGGLGPGRTGATGLSVAAASPSAGATAGATATRYLAVMLDCANGPTSMRTPGWHQHPTGPPWVPPTPGLPSPEAPTSGATSSMEPPSGYPSSGYPSSGYPSSSYSSSGYPSSGGTSPGATSSAASPTTWSPPSGTAAESPSASGDPVELRAARAGQAIEELAMSDYADRYFGTCRDRNTDTLYVMRVPGGDLDTAVTRMAAADWPTVKVAFADAAGSRSQLMALVKRITADTEEWRTKGVVIEAATLAIDGAGVVVDTPQWQSAGAEIKERYGPLVAEVR